MTFSVIGIDTQTGQRVAIFKLSRLLGLYCIGMQRMGKSGLFEELILQDIKQGTGVCVLDPHGELIDHIIARLRNRAEEEKVILLDITDEERPFGVNLFACANPTNDSAIMKPLRQVLHTFEKAYGISPTTPIMYDLLYKTAYVLIANPGYTMVDISLFLTNEACRKKLVQKVPSPDVHTFWEHWDDPKQKVSKEQEADSKTILNKLNDFSHAPLYNIIGQSSSTMNLQEIMDAGKVLLIKLSRQLEQATSLIGSIIVALILNAADTRTTNKLFNLYADEFQNFATEDFAVLLEQSSKRGIGVTMAHQNRAQLETSDKQAEANLRARTLNVGNLVVFRVPTDAHELAGQFDITPAPERIEEIEKEELIGQRPVRAYKRDVIGHLLRQGHEDERVMAFVIGYLRELKFASEQQVRQERREHWSRYTGTSYTSEMIYPVNSLGIAYNPEALKPVLEKLNDYLFEGMRDGNMLWQPLHSFYTLAHFFGFDPIYEALYSYPLDAVERWQKFQAEDFLAYEARHGFERRNLVNFALIAIEEAYIDFLSFLFQTHSRTSLQTAWQDNRIHLPTTDFLTIQDRSLASLGQITDALRGTVSANPALGQAAYTRRFMQELAGRERSLVFFLPFLYCSYHGAGAPDYRWRSIKHTDDIAVNIGYGRKNPWRIMEGQRVDTTITVSEHDAEFAVTYTYHLKMFKSVVYQGIVENIQTYLRPLLYYLQFISHLHCAQLALCQRPIETMDSGQYEQDKRTQTHYIMHAQRPYADMLNEVAKELVRLPKYTARVKLTDENDAVVEYLITTMKPGTGLYGKPLQERVDRIRERNMRDGYLRERTAVEAEIRLRQELWREPPVDEPPIYRRPHR